MEQHCQEHRGGSSILRVAHGLGGLSSCPQGSWSWAGWDLKLQVWPLTEGSSRWWIRTPMVTAQHKPLQHTVLASSGHGNPHPSLPCIQLPWQKSFTSSARWGIKGFHCKVRTKKKKTQFRKGAWTRTVCSWRSSVVSGVGHWIWVTHSWQSSIHPSPGNLGMHQSEEL